MTTADMTPAAAETLAPITVTIDDAPDPRHTALRGWRACPRAGP